MWGTFYVQNYMGCNSMVGEFNTYNKMNHLLKCCSLREPNFTVLYQIEFYEHVFEFMSYYIW